METEIEKDLRAFQRSHHVLQACVFDWHATEDVDSGTVLIKIKANGIGGQSCALWEEIALPLLRENRAASTAAHQNN